MNSQAKSPYVVLGVSPTASAKEIQSAYRQLAKKYHPDINPDNPEATEKFKEVAQAYSILSNQEKRKDYDHGLIDFNGNPVHSHESYNNWPGEDVYNHMHGYGFHFHKPQIRNPNTTLHYEVDASSLFSEHDATIKYQRTISCRDCNGNGGTGNYTICHTCNGSGRFIQIKRIGNMVMQQDHGVCPTCNGRGKIFDDNCKACDGIGLKTSNEEITINIPANCAYGRIVVSERGHQETLDAPPGDLVIVVIPKSRHCKFDGYTANYELLIDPIRAMLGCKVKAHGLKPKEEFLIDIPKMTEPHTRIVMKHKGLCDMNGKRHDANIFVVYKMPDKLSSEQEAALKAYLTVNEKTQE